MITTFSLLTGVLTSGLLLSSFSPAAPTASPSSASRVVFTQVLPEGNFVSYTTNAGETLESISQDHYGDNAYWKTIWNDNQWVEDPNDLKNGLTLQLRVNKPEKPDETVDKLVETESVEAAQPTIAENELPTPVAVVVSPSVSPIQATNTPPAASVTITAPVSLSQGAATSPISEEAITYLGSCEAGMDPAKNTGNGYYGAFQFSYGTWKNMNTGYERADLAPIEVQKAAVKQLIQRSSIYTQFPSCAIKMRNAGLI